MLFQKDERKQIFRPNYDCYYVRLWISNCGKTRAENVEVFVANIAKKINGNKYVNLENFLPMNLIWAHTKIRKSGPEIITHGISPEMGKHCDLGYIIKPKDRDQIANAFSRDNPHDLPNISKEKTIMCLVVEKPSNTKGHLLGPGDYQLTLEVAASNAKPNQIKIQLSITGDWFEEGELMFTKGIIVEVID
jgi:hypothetical protein